MKKGETGTGLGSLKSSHLFTNRARDSVMPHGRRRQFTSLLKTVRDGNIAIGLFMHGLKFRLVTLEALLQVRSGIDLFSEFGL
jgi:hypothetical protein